MDQHPYFNVIAACLAASTVAVIACLALTAWLLTEKARTAACDRRNAQAAETRDARFYSGAAAVLSQPADNGPLDDEGRWAL